MPKFFEDLERNDPGAPVVTLLAVKFLVITYFFVYTLTPARCEEFNLKKDLWSIPAERMKIGSQHQITLTDPPRTC
ncbi:phage integrase [Synechococcus sp. A18-25c]|nr:phage integrase [Synechococcus sp. A18-25c]